MSNSLCVTQITHAVQASAAAQAARNNVKILAFSEALEKLNGDMPATVDIMGRLHAPFSGYQSECGHVYDKGQFIPVNVDEYQGNERNKIRVSGEGFISALKADSELSTRVGTTWVTNDGIMQANLYLEIAKGEEDSVYVVINNVQSSYGVKIIGHTVDGKQQVSGVITSLWQRSSEYGTQEGFTVQLETGEVYQGTLPKSAYDADKGDAITFTATFTEGSAYFKRPSKAKLVKGAVKSA